MFSVLLDIYIPLCESFRHVMIPYALVQCITRQLLFIKIATVSLLHSNINIINSCFLSVLIQFSSYQCSPSLSSLPIIHYCHTASSLPSSPTKVHLMRENSAVAPFVSEIWRYMACIHEKKRCFFFLLFRIVPVQYCAQWQLNKENTASWGQAPQTSQDNTSACGLFLNGINARTHTPTHTSKNRQTYLAATRTIVPESVNTIHIK